MGLAQERDVQKVPTVLAKNIVFTSLFFLLGFEQGVMTVILKLECAPKSPRVRI